ncbi:hypothetical protein Rcae01_06775 [Novipirellula caenicola]|uniref:Uncharacterized protein n=1 Tax=Novipirellula caenicola TaxID=1536901 RepID=A0ABP9W1K0_9BACT
MPTCPECDSNCDDGRVVSNAATCPVCDRPVYIVRDPRDRLATYAAISNSDSLDVPDDVLTYPIIDQSSQDQPPRNMILEFPDDNACLIAQCSSPTQQKRELLDKPAFALKRTVLSVHLPVELMSYIRSTYKPNNYG